MKKETTKRTELSDSSEVWHLLKVVMLCSSKGTRRGPSTIKLCALSCWNFGNLKGNDDLNGLCFGGRTSFDR